tara:strand:+ start:216 stop:626 length:411 start_codon:yes stop_codon:yes gene_type:complete
MNKKAIEEYSDTVRAALKALTTEQVKAMHAERVGASFEPRSTQEEQLDEVICDNAACGTEVAFQELYDLIELLAHKPPRKRYTCPACGSEEVWIAVRVNPNTGYTDEDSEDPAGCWNESKDGCFDVSRVADLIVES